MTVRLEGHSRSTDARVTNPRTAEDRTAGQVARLPEGNLPNTIRKPAPEQPAENWQPVIVRRGA